ncbi:MAG: TldD/PmbA family protein [Firmicutes bacterium]|uniref:TldD/PmbA family protein n=1 Tax=Candidatus Onthovivens merdipullorum TaxID=2840889 RepID=A0A9D9DJ12_9BACL|nr:TldD/PmbA family protein [Candidatus Onthovivens merdipullorum]
MINKKLATYILNLSLETGADFAEIYEEETIDKNVRVVNGLVENAASSISYGVGLRLLNGLKSVYGYTNDSSKKGLEKLALSLRGAFSEERKIPEIKELTIEKVKNFYNKCTSLLTISTDDIVSLLKNVNKEILSYDNRIVKSTASFSISKTTSHIFNSNSKIFNNTKEYGRLGLLSIASQNGKMEMRFDGPGSQSGWEFFTKTLDLNNLIKEHSSKLILMLEAKECPSGKFPVVIGNGWGGVIFHEACGHQLEASAVGKNMSVFSGMLNKQIANTCVTAYDDGTIPNEWGSNLIDDEGHPTQKNLLIENGILKGYLIDDFTGRRMNMKGNGACRRESYKYEPTSRMSNTYIAPGKYTPEEIIANTKLGIYAKSFNGGSVDPTTGDFNFGCSEAYIIKDGKITTPVRGATLVGNAKDILKHIDMVGNDLALGQGMCGAASGSIPVDVGQPTIRVDEISVGGRGGDIHEY